MREGYVLLNMRWLLGGIALLLLILLGISWVGERREVKLLDRRVELLQQALAPTSPWMAANSWAEAMKDRNGAWQYALLSEALRAKYRHEFEELNWVTGTSSPWVDNYEVRKVDEDAQGSIQYEIKFNWYTAEGYFGSSIAEIWVAAQEEDSNQVWYIRQIKYNDTEMDKNTIAVNGLKLVVKGG